MINLEKLNKKYSNKSIYILQCTKGNNVFVSYGQPPEFDDTDIKHKCRIEHGSLGAPILLFFLILIEIILINIY